MQQQTVATAMATATKATLFDKNKERSIKNLVPLRARFPSSIPLRTSAHTPFDVRGDQG